MKKAGMLNSVPAFFVPPAGPELLNLSVDYSVGSDIFNTLV